MVALLGINVYSWNKIMVNNDHELKRIYEVINSCNNK